MGRCWHRMRLSSSGWGRWEGAWHVPPLSCTARHDPAGKSRQTPPRSTERCNEPLTKIRWIHSTNWGAQLSPLHPHMRDARPSPTGRAGPDPISLSPAHPGRWAAAPALLAVEIWPAPPCKHQLMLRRDSLGNLCNECSSTGSKHQLSEEAVTPLAPGPQSHLIISLPKHGASQITPLWARR